jgi:hypothetical protein
MNWIKSTKCGESTTTCVEVAFEGGLVAVRNSQIPGEIVWFTPDEWAAFLAGTKLGEFNL